MFLESINVTDGKVLLQEFHQERMTRTAHDFNFPSPDLQSIIHTLSLPAIRSKMRICYGPEGFEVEISPYNSPEIHAFYLTPTSASYAYKFLDRTFIDDAKKFLPAKSDVIFTKDNVLTDMSIGNLVFKTMDQNLYTPENPLLEGVMRRYLIQNKRIRETKILISDLDSFTEFQWVNALNPLSDDRFLPITNIILPRE